MSNLIYPGIPGAPAYAGTTSPSGSSGHQAPPPDSNGDGGSNPPPTDTGDNASPPDSGGGLISVDGSNGGIDVDVVDTDGDDHGLIDAHSDAPGGIIGDGLDGTHIDVVNADSLVDAHVPGVLDATVGDGTVADLIGDATSGDGDGGLGGFGGLGGLGDLSGLTDGLQGIQVDALQNGNILEAHAGDAADIVVGGDTGLGNLLGSVSEAGDGSTGGISVEALNGENIAEVHAGDGINAIVGDGSDAGGLLGNIATLGDAGDAATGPLGLNVEALNGEYVAEAHAPGTLDATVGGAELGNLVGGAELGGILDGGLLGGDGLLGDALNVGSIGDIGGLDIGHTLDSAVS